MDQICPGRPWRCSCCTAHYFLSQPCLPKSAQILYFPLLFIIFSSNLTLITLKKKVILKRKEIVQLSSSESKNNTIRLLNVLSLFIYLPSSESDQILLGVQREMAVFCWLWHTLYAAKPNTYLFKILMQLTECCLADKHVHQRLLCALSSVALQASLRGLVGRRNILESKGLLPAL